MKKSTIISIVLALFIIIALVFVLFTKESTAPDSASSTSSSGSDSARSDDRITGGGQYLVYSEEVLANAPGQKVLFFHAPWCPQCRSIERTILENKNSIPKGVSIIKVDYDSNQALRQKYGVTIQTTFVKIDDSGNLIDKYVAYNEPTIEAVNRDFL
ncbi:MAG TPA: thioredoxin family protein [Candidatus Saccharimonadales bacterium]|nr:thioredoxin family protein [Candidatus Saccharimonadales bacterium]